MSKSIKIIMMALSIAFIFITFDRFMTIEDRQINERNEIIELANTYIEHGIYQRAIPIIRNLIDTEPTIYEAANRRYELMMLHYKSGDMISYRNVLQEILDIGIPPKDTTLADLYLELFSIEKDNSRMETIIELLRRAANNTNDSRLVNLFENYRFHYTIRQNNFDYIGVTNIDNAIAYRNGYYHLINVTGNNIVESNFEFATNFIGNYAVVQRDGILEIINRMGARQAIANFNVNSLNFFDGTTFVHSLDGYDGYFIGNWPNDSLTFYRGYDSIDFIGAVSEGIRVFERDGLYFASVASQQSSQSDQLEFVNFEYTGIAIDELGRSAVNGRIFTNSGNGYYMKDLDGNIIAGSFEEAHPFFETNGLAAVKRDGLWGLINSSGEMIVDFIYEETASSSFGLAAIKKDGLWGYITLAPYPENSKFAFRIVIEPQFHIAKQFVNGAAPVKTEDGWAHITLTARG